MQTIVLESMKKSNANAAKRKRGIKNHGSQIKTCKVSNSNIMLVEKEDYITESLNLIGRKPVQQWQRVKQLKH
jgi:hypothetical protein